MAPQLDPGVAVLPIGLSRGPDAIPDRPPPPADVQDEDAGVVVQKVSPVGVGVGPGLSRVDVKAGGQRGDQLQDDGDGNEEAEGDGQLLPEGSQLEAGEGVEGFEGKEGQLWSEDLKSGGGEGQVQDGLRDVERLLRPHIR